MTENYYIVHTYQLFFIHSLVDVYLVGYDSLVFVNSAIVNMDVQVSLVYSDLHSSRHMPNGVTGPCGRSVFCFLRNHNTDSHNGYTNLHSHHNCITVPFCQCSHQHLFSFSWWWLFWMGKMGFQCDLRFAFPLWLRRLNISSSVFSAIFTSFENYWIS
jgi:hypothetical protein